MSKVKWGITEQAVKDAIGGTLDRAYRNDRNVEAKIPTAHEQMSGRDAEDQHPIRAIKDLQDNLDNRLTAVFLSNAEIDAIMNM